MAFNGLLHWRAEASFVMIVGCALAILDGVYLETTNAAEVYCLNKSSGLSVMTAAIKSTMKWPCRVAVMWHAFFLVLLQCYSVTVQMLNVNTF